jgi:hypothetical protein
MTLPFDCMNPDLIAFYSTELYLVRVYQLDCKDEIRRINKPSWARELIIGERFFLRGMFFAGYLNPYKKEDGLIVYGHDNLSIIISEQKLRLSCEGGGVWPASAVVADDFPKLLLSFWNGRPPVRDGGLTDPLSDPLCATCTAASTC